MAIRLYIGDSHGNFEDFNKIVSDALGALDGGEVSEVISVGDFGYWPHKSYQRQGFDLPVRFIDGNHEHFDLLSVESPSLPNERWDCRHIARGTFDGGVFFMGGATSIDRARRTEGLDWFDAENISYSDFNAAAEAAEANAQAINVMCCHDSIQFAYHRLLGNKGGYSRDNNAQALEGLFTIARPKVYIHGHHHTNQRYSIDGCEFVALDLCHYGRTFDKCSIAISDEGEIFDW